MGLLDWLFGKKEPEQVKAVPVVAESQPEVLETEWEEVPFYVPNDDGEEELVSVIATAIAAADRPTSQFTVTSIKKKNPEAELVAVIASSIAAGDQPESQLQVKRIFKRK